MLCIREMTLVDMPVGLHLCRQAGWNQTEADWRRFLELQPDGCFVAECDGSAVATTCAFVFGPVAWIAAVLVDERYRSRGIGRALMVHALDFLDRRDVTSVRLHATPLGQPLYEMLGFVEEYRLARYEGAPIPTSEVAGVETAAPSDWQSLAALDAEVTGTDRRLLMRRLCEETPDDVRVVRAGNAIRGFRLSRRGFRATLLGPCIAAPDAGPLLLQDGWCRHAGSVAYIDVPLGNEAACRLAESQGLRVQRYLTRMCRGVQACERLDWLWASSGPEKG